MEYPLYITIASFFILLTISGFSTRIARKFNIPHTVFLVLVGILIAILSDNLSFLSFLKDFQLSPELIFYVFLPTLIFESAFKLPLRKMVLDAPLISLLSFLGYFLSVSIITCILLIVFPIFGFEIPILFIILFAIIISATDPVAVLSVFKKLGIRPRLVRIFEGESLFNDGAAWASFIIFLEVLYRHELFTLTDIPLTFLKFLVMIFGGIGFGILMGFLFSYLIQNFKNEETVELTLTLIMAHMTFLLADMAKHVLCVFGETFEISSIIATVVASMILGSNGIQKFSPHVRKHMMMFWEYFAFIANSLIFLLIGILAVHAITVECFLLMIIPLLIVIITVVFARYLSIYFCISVYNIFLSKESYFYISDSWRRLISWISLRGAIAIATILSLPEDFSIIGWNFPVSEKHFLTHLVVGCILFTVFLKAGTVHLIVKKMGLSSFSRIDKVEALEVQIIMDINILKRIEVLMKKGYISKENAETLLKEYKKDKEALAKKLYRFFSEELSEEEAEQILRIQAFLIEEKILQQLLDGNEIIEKIFWEIKKELLEKKEAIEFKKKYIKNSTSVKNISKEDIVIQYKIARAKIILFSKVLKQLSIFQNKQFSIPQNILKKVIMDYEKIKNKEKKILLTLKNKFPSKTKKIEKEIFLEFIKNLEKKFIKHLHQTSIIKDRVFSYLSKK